MQRWLPLILILLALAACGPAPDAPAATRDGNEDPQPFRTATAEAGLVDDGGTMPDETPEPLTLEGDPFAAIEATEAAKQAAQSSADDDDDAMAQADATSVPVITLAPTAIPVVEADGVRAATTTAEAAAIRDRDYVKGASAESALVTIIEYSDFQCPACRSFTPVLSDLVTNFPDAVRVVYRHNPLDGIHPNATLAAQAAEAAGAQGQFWPFHDQLFEQQEAFANADSAGARDIFIDIATALDLDVEQFTDDLDSERYADYVKVLQQEASNIRLTSTPSLLVNGQPVSGQGLPFDYNIWANFVEGTIAQAELAERQYAAAPPMTIDLDTIYEAVVEMEDGSTFVMELYPASAPETVNSFVFLAREGWFDNVTFHRVLPGFVAQTGDPTGTGSGGPGYALPNEIDPDLTHAESGMVAMANSGPNTNGSQWYITLGDASFLDGSYTIFGRVIDGFDVVEQLTPRDPERDPSAEPGDLIVSVTIREQ